MAGLVNNFKKIIILGAILNLSGCLKPDSESSPSEAPSTLVISGKVALANGSAAPNVQIYTDIDTESRLLTNGQGEFSLTLSSTELITLGTFSETTKTTFNLYFEQTDGGKLRAISAPINSATAGTMTLEPVTLMQSAGVSGKILVLGEDGKLAVPTDHIELVVGRSKGIADAKGNFAINGLPAGKVPAQAKTASSAIFSDTWTLTAGQTTAFEQPFILFPETGMHGLLQQDDSVSDDSIQLKTPYTRSFIARSSAKAGLIRYHHNRVDMETDGLVAWRPIQQRFDYDFGSNGGHTLYYQFSDSENSLISQLYSLESIIDPLGMSTGFVINEGSGVSKSYDLSLKIDVPPSAFRMRIAESEDLLRVADWMVPQPLYNYRIDIDDYRDVGSRTIYVQFADAKGAIGPYFTSVVLLDIWPRQNPGVFTINNGDQNSKSRLVRLDINVPTQAHEMLIFEEGSNQTTNVGISGNGGTTAVGVFQTKNIWLAVSPVMYFNFTGPGQKNLYVQFRTIDQISSPVYNQFIRIEPFPVGPDLGFVINNSDPFSRTRYLDVTLLPPFGSIRFKIGETPQSLFSTQWLSLTPNYVFPASGPGLKNIYVTYQNIDGDDSAIFIQSIYIEAFPPNTGDFIINRGATVALSPKLRIDLLAPVNARHFMIAEGIVPEENFVEWREIQPDVALTVFGTGSKLIYVRYRSDDGLVSAPVQRTIFYDPFPYGTAGVIINDGASTTTSATVNLRVYGEINLITMRIATDIQMLNQTPFLEFREFLTHQLPAENGPYKVYIQFKTATGEISPVYFSDITKNTPPPPTP